MLTWAQILWPMVAAMSLTLGSIHGAGWVRHRSPAHLAFACAAMSVAAMALLELAFVRASGAGDVAALGRWMQVPFATLVVALAWFVHALLGAGNLVLGAAAAVARAAVMPMESALGAGWAAPVADALLLAYLLLALARASRRGEPALRRTAGVVCGSWAVCVAIASVAEMLAASGDASMRGVALAAFALAIAVTGTQLGVGHAAGALGAAASARASERLLGLVESVPIALLLVNRHGLVALANSQAARVFGVERDAMPGRPLEAFLPRRAPGGQADAASADIPRETVALRADGREVPVAVSLKPAALPDGMGTLAAVTDISALKRAESDAAQQRDELAHMSRVTMIGELSGGLAHELNQPLMAILSNAQAAQRILLRAPTDIDELRDILADIVDDDRRAGEVIHRMRALLKKEHIDHAPLDANALIADALRLVRSDLIHRGVEARMHLAPGLPTISGDPVQLQQVIVNLVFNACDAMQGSHKPVVHVRTALSAQGAVRICVEDAGCGIAPEKLDRIFEPFETTKPHGMGLGLAVCRTIVSAHGGMIWAENLTPGARLCLEFVPAAPAA